MNIPKNICETIICSLVGATIVIIIGWYSLAGQVAAYAPVNWSNATSLESAPFPLGALLTLMGICTIIICVSALIICLMHDRFENS